MSKILIVDDDRIMVELLCTLLSMDGHEVQGSGRKGDVLATLQDGATELLLMDVLLGGEESIDLLGKIRTEPGLKKLRVIMTSGLDLSERCRNAGCDAFLPKPFTPEQLFEAIDHVMNDSNS
jgi:two-component system OmpR family response regulator